MERLDWMKRQVRNAVAQAGTTLLSAALRLTSPLEVQIWVLPVLPLAVAIESRAVKLHLFVGAERDPDVVAGEQVLTLRAEAHFVEGPPAFQRVGVLKELQLSPGGFWKSWHDQI